MNSVNKTLYIPLYGKALVSKRGIILDDKKAEEIWGKVEFSLKRKSKSKWLALYMGMRSRVFDDWVEDKLKEFPNSVVLNLGCGLDSRFERVKELSKSWYDVDFETVINERKNYYKETEIYHMICADVRDCSFISGLEKAERAIVVLEGLSMYLTNDQLRKIFASLNEYFPHLSVLIDCYTPFAVKMSKIKNPVNEVGVAQVFGVENSKILEKDTGLT
ncbi:MAG: class I SAM-dependent methyltransferase, partial [Clostridia bacterium]|nr:class I SAM-dependent methyltransferase [Clostridia bacterium]